MEISFLQLVFIKIHKRGSSILNYIVIFTKEGDFLKPLTIGGKQR